MNVDDEEREEGEVREEEDDVEMKGIGKTEKRVETIPGISFPVSPLSTSSFTPSTLPPPPQRQQQQQQQNNPQQQHRQRQTPQQQQGGGSGGGSGAGGMEEGEVERWNSGVSSKLKSRGEKSVKSLYSYYESLMEDSDLLSLAISHFLSTSPSSPSLSSTPLLFPSPDIYSFPFLFSFLSHFLLHLPSLPSSLRSFFSLHLLLLFSFKLLFAYYLHIIYILFKFYLHIICTTLQFIYFNIVYLCYLFIY